MSSLFILEGTGGLQGFSFFSEWMVSSQQVRDLNALCWVVRLIKLGVDKSEALGYDAYELRRARPLPLVVQERESMVLVQDAK